MSIRRLNAAEPEDERSLLLPQRRVQNEDNNDNYNFGWNNKATNERQPSQRTYYAAFTCAVPVVLLMLLGVIVSRITLSSTQQQQQQQQQQQHTYPALMSLTGNRIDMTTTTTSTALSFPLLTNHHLQLVHLWDDWKANLQHDTARLLNWTQQEAAESKEWWQTQAEPTLEQDAKGAWQTAVQDTEQVQAAAQEEWQQLHTDQWGEKLHQVGEDIAQATQQAEHAVEHTWNASVETVQEHYDPNWRQETQDWFHQAWDATSEEAHDVWVNLEQDEQQVQAKGSVWWDKTVHSEQDWSHNVLNNLHRFGQHVKSWWNTTSRDVVDEESTLQNNFENWWHNATEAEKHWWNGTQHAFQRFEHAAGDKTRTWWNITKHASSTGWNHTVEKEHEWWNTTEEWFHKHQRHPPNPLDRPLRYLNTSHAYSLLMNGYGWYDYSADFFLYQTGLDAQINQAFCAVASTAALLNSLNGLVDLPIDPLYVPYPYATQVNVLNNTCVNDRVVRYNETFDGILSAPGGLSLYQTKDLLKCNLPSETWHVTAYEVDLEQNSTDNVRRDLELALKNPRARVMVNYDRAVLDQDGHGHFSPVASYAAAEDSFLILDVAKYKYPPSWVPAARLVAAMSTHDACGRWEYPTAQDDIRPDLLHPDSDHGYEKALRKLGCQTAFRGYIIVEMK